MKTAICIFVACVLAAAADKKPNFSGDWKMDLAKSAVGPIPAPTSLTRKIVHFPSSLIITEEQTGGTGDHIATRRYTTDGKPVTFQENGANIVATALWEGDAMVITSKADAGGTTITFTEKMTLSSGGKILTDVLHIVTPQGEIDATYAFAKQ